MTRARVRQVVGAALAGDERQHGQAMRVRRQARDARARGRVSSFSPSVSRIHAARLPPLLLRAADDDPAPIEPVAPQAERHRRRRVGRPDLPQRARRADHDRGASAGRAARLRRCRARRRPRPEPSARPAAAASAARSRRSAPRSVSSRSTNRAELVGRDVARGAQLRIPASWTVVQEHAGAGRLRQALGVAAEPSPLQVGGQRHPAAGAAERFRLVIGEPPQARRPVGRMQPASGARVDGALVEPLAHRHDLAARCACRSRESRP